MLDALTTLGPYLLGFATVVMGILRDQNASITKALEAERERAAAAEAEADELRAVLDACDCHKHRAPDGDQS